MNDPIDYEANTSQLFDKFYDLDIKTLKTMAMYYDMKLTNKKIKN